jgi:hypothetical protein
MTWFKFVEMRVCTEVTVISVMCVLHDFSKSACCGRLEALKTSASVPIL